jgi:hypothetical protein
MSLSSVELSRGGWNNNPTARQFKFALRAIMMSEYIKPSCNANVEHFDDAEEWVLDFRRSKRAAPESVTIPDNDFQEEIALISRQLGSFFLRMETADWRDNVLFYTAGFVARKLEKIIDCDSCVGAIFLDENDVLSKDPSLIRHEMFFQRRQRGGLRTPSCGVYTVVQAAEKAFRSLVPLSANVISMPALKNIDLKIEHIVLQSLPRSRVFPLLFLEHFCDHDFLSESDHVTKLIRLICKYYVKIRLYKYGKLFTERRLFCTSVASRQENTKMILFRGQ